MKKISPYFWLLAMAIVVAQMVSCKKDPLPEVIAGFTYQVDASDFKKVTFTNASQNFSRVIWDFGDGSATVTDENPVHTYPGAGTYTVKLTAVSNDGKSNDVLSQAIAITDPDAELTKLVGDVSKSWKLLRVTAPGRWPLEVGPISKDQVWWAQGRDNDEIALRPCIMNDEYIFGRDGSYKYRTNGDFWAEGGVFEPANLCQDANATNLVGPGGIDLSAFGDGDHTFTLVNGTKPTLTVSGLGAFIGLPKIATDYEVSVPQNSVTLNIIKLSDGAVDTLILESDWKFQNNTSGQPDAYWKITLVHYDNPGDEPPIPDPKPVTSFTASVDGLTVTFTNNSKYATSYNWDFGDGNSSTESSPVHTYAAAGAYNVTLTSTNSVGTSSATQQFVVTSGAMTEADLIGAPWKIRYEPNSIFVGPGLGNSSWWICPFNYMDGSSTGADDWSCITNDEFIFTAGGVYEYKTNGDARNDGYMGSPNGCISDAELAASGNGAAFGSAVHSFTFTPAAGSNRPVITLTNGATGAAFIGFYKGYYGGENTDSANAPNGGQSTNRYEVMSYVKDASGELLTVSVDISTTHDGSRAWTMVLHR